MRVARFGRRVSHFASAEVIVAAQLVEKKAQARLGLRFLSFADGSRSTDSDNGLQWGGSRAAANTTLSTFASTAPPVV